jgi:transposase
LTAELVREGVFTSVHYTSVFHLLKEADLQPHRTLYWKRGCDPDFESKAIRVLWYYEQARALWERDELLFCFDEKPGIQMLRPLTRDEPPRPGCPLRRDFEYRRLGTGLLLFGMNLVTGEIFCRTPRRKNSQNLTRTLDSHLKSLGDFRRVHYIMDNDPTHTSKHTARWLESQEGRVRFHFTPKYSSWLNQAEIGLHRFSSRYLTGRYWQDRNDFAPHIRRSVHHYNREFAEPIDWSFTRNRFHEWYSLQN